MNCFVDTSALSKKYVEEAGTPELLALLEKAERVFVSPVTRIECASMLSRLRHFRQIGWSDAQVALDAIGRDTESFDQVRFDEILESTAMQVSLDHNLKTLDSIQLASALVRKNEIQKFVASDRKLLAAARKEKFEVEDPAA